MMDFVRQLQMLAAATGVMHQKEAVQNRRQVIYGISIMRAGENIS